MRQALADTAAAGQDDRPSAGGDVDMVDQGAAAPGKHTRQTVTYPHNRGVHTRNRWRDLHGRHTRRPESERRAHTSGGTAARTCARAAVRGATTTGARRAMPRRARGSRPGSRITYGSAHA